MIDRLTSRIGDGLIWVVLGFPKRRQSLLGRGTDGRQRPDNCSPHVGYSMPFGRSTRRDFLRTSALGTTGLLAAPYVATGDAQAKDRSKSKNDRFRIGAIGMRYQGTVITDGALPWGDVVAICDVDREIAEKAREHYGGKADLYEDYRKMLDRRDIDVVTIGTPDHWHTAMAIAACKAGKHVYCEKPLTLTIDEGKLLCKVVQHSGVVFQVGTRYRSDHHCRLACETVHAGRLGKLKRITVGLGKNPQGGPFKVEDPPPHLNWDLWIGQAPLVPYTKERCHFTFRWWYEYAGGKQADTDRPAGSASFTSHVDSDWDSSVALRRPVNRNHVGPVHHASSRSKIEQFHSVGMEDHVIFGREAAKNLDAGQDAGWQGKDPQDLPVAATHCRTGNWDEDHEREAHQCL